MDVGNLMAVTHIYQQNLQAMGFTYDEAAKLFEQYMVLERRYREDSGKNAVELLECVTNYWNYLQAAPIRFSERSVLPIDTAISDLLEGLHLVLRKNQKTSGLPLL